jgi:hypothetical protein
MTALRGGKRLNHEEHKEHEEKLENQFSSGFFSSSLYFVFFVFFVVQSLDFDLMRPGFATA